MATEQIIWDEICQNMITQLVDQQFRDAVVAGVMNIGEVLNQFYAQTVKEHKNELANAPIIFD